MSVNTNLAAWSIAAHGATSACTNRANRIPSIPPNIIAELAARVVLVADFACIFAVLADNFPPQAAARKPKDWAVRFVVTTLFQIPLREFSMLVACLLHNELEFTQVVAIGEVGACCHQSAAFFRRHLITTAGRCLFWGLEVRGGGCGGHEARDREKDRKLHIVGLS
jgi:hypothetical protein